MNEQDLKKRSEEFSELYENVRKEIGKALVGQDDLVEHCIVAILGGGHVLLEGVPGLGKTLLVQSIASVLGLPSARIQFTVDLMPTDITGTSILEITENGSREMSFRPGPLLSSVVLADEINRATPKTQSAMLEAMAEAQITVFGETRKIEPPYFVLATQNSIEMEGTFPLPEAQLDRFFFKLLVPFPTESELVEVLRRTTQPGKAELQELASRKRILEAQQLVKEVPISDAVLTHVAKLILATQPESADASDLVKRYVRAGASPRGAQTLVRGAKIHALLKGRFAATIADVHAYAKAALRHRLYLNFEAQADGISADHIIEQLLKQFQ